MRYHSSNPNNIKKQINPKVLQPPGTSDDWISFELRFPTEARGQAVILEFRMLTDGDDSVGAGWYIDDIIIDR